MADKLDKLLKKARALRDKGKLERSLKHYRNACAEPSSSADVWRERAEVAERAGALEEAVIALYRAADVCAKSGERAQATELAERILSLDPDHEGARALARRPGSEPGVASDDGDAEVDAEGEGDAGEAEADAEGEGDAGDAEADAEGEKDAQAEADGEGEKDAQAEADGEGEKDAQAEADAEGEGDAVADAAYEAEAEADREGEARADADREPGSDAAPGSHHEGDAAPQDERGKAAAAEPDGAGEPGSMRESEAGGEAVADGTVEAAAEASASGRLALDEISLIDLLPGGAPDAPAELALDIPEPGGRSVRAATATAAAGEGSRLCELDSDLVARLIDSGALVFCRADRAVFSQGDAGESMFLLLQGELVVERADGDRGPMKTIAQLRSGALFGEMSVLTDAPRSATVRAERDATLIEVSRDTIRKLIRKEERLIVLLMRFFRARLVGNLMASSPLFSSLDDDEREDLLAKFRLWEYPERFEVLGEGATADGLYLVLAGELAAVARGGDDEPRVLGRLGPGDGFGEVSRVFRGDTRSATVRAESRAWVLELDGPSFSALVEARPEVGERLEALAADLRRRGDGDAELALAAVRPV